MNKKNAIIKKEGGIDFIKGLVLLFCLITLKSCTTTPTIGRLENSVLNINQAQLKQLSAIRLTGEWDFYWKQFPIDSSGQFALNQLTKKTKLNHSSGVWSDYGFPSKGYGTYTAQLRNLDSTQHHMLRILRVRSSCTVWANGKELGSIGKISTSEKEAIPGGELLYVELPKASNIDLIIAVSNYHHRYGGGSVFGIYLGNSKVMDTHRENTLLISMSSTMFIFIISLFSIINFFLVRKKNYLLLYFGVFTFSIALRELFVGEVFIYRFFPNMSFSLVHKMRYIPLYLGLIGIVLYFKELFKNESKTWFVYTTIIFSVIMLAAVISAPVYLSSYAPLLHIYFCWIFLAYMIFIVTKAVLNKRRLSKILFFNVLLAVIVFSNDLLYSENQIQTAFISNFGLLGFLLLQSIINQKTYLETEHKLEELSSQLIILKEEVALLLTESIKELRSKQKLTDKLNVVQKNLSDETLKKIILELKSDKLRTERLLLLKENIQKLNANNNNQKLKILHPELTQTDIEICVFISIGLTSKDIASLRGVSSLSVKTSRYRIRKKIGLQEGDSLSTYLSSLKL